MVNVVRMIFVKSEVGRAEVAHETANSGYWTQRIACAIACAAIAADIMCRL